MTKKLYKVAQREFVERGYELTKGDEALIGDELPAIRKFLGNYEERIAAWVAEHPDGVVRECVNPAGQAWAEEQMDLAFRSGVAQWHEAFRRNRESLICGVRHGVRNSRLGFVVEGWDHLGFGRQIGDLVKAVNLYAGSDKEFSFDVETEGVAEALLAFDSWLETNTEHDLRLYMVESDNEELVIVLHPESHLADSLTAFEPFGYDMKPLTPDLL